jgi:spoIIIJ-associated protein
MTEQEAETTAPLSVEAEGETVGEAKWSALRELERRCPGLDKGSVRFAVVSEGERGLLGVGYAPAKVIEEEPGSPAALLRELVEQIAKGLGAPVAVSIREDDESLVAMLTGPDLGLVIGKHGQTIDAIQYLANAIVWRGHEDRKSVVVDAAGYRDRRRASLEQLADRAAGEARASRKDVSLEPMSAVERKIVHVYLEEREDVETTSEGTEPNRYVVIKPVA